MSEIIDLVQELADELTDSGHEIDVLDMLEGLGLAGLMLVRATTAENLEVRDAYVALISQEPDDTSRETTQ